MNKSIFFMLICCFFLSFIEYSRNEYLEETSRILIQFIQKADNHWISSSFYYIDQITSVCFLIFSGFLFLSYNTEDGFLCILAGYSGAAFSGILKALFAHPRPLWKYEDIKAVACPKDWGSPSGHSMAAGTPLLVIFLLLVKKNYPKKYCFIVLLSLLLTAFTRLYIGAHFFFQILLGFAFSGLLALILVNIHIQQLFQFTCQKFCIKSQICMFFMMLLSVSLINLQDPLWRQYWTDNFEAKCPGSLTNENAQDKALMDSLLWANIGGLLAGRYFLGPGNFYCTSKVLSLVAFTLSIYLTLQIDQVFKSNKLILLVSRYIEGAFLSYILPTLCCTKTKE